MRVFSRVGMGQMGPQRTCLIFHLTAADVLCVVHHFGSSLGSCFFLFALARPFFFVPERREKRMKEEETMEEKTIHEVSHVDEKVRGCGERKVRIVPLILVGVTEKNVCLRSLSRSRASSSSALCCWCQASALRLA